MCRVDLVFRSDFIGVYSRRYQDTILSISSHNIACVALEDHVTGDLAATPVPLLHHSSLLTVVGLDRWTTPVLICDVCRVSSLPWSHVAAPTDVNRLGVVL